MTVTDEVQGSDGHIWYQLQVTVSGVTQTGYTRSDFVRLDSAGTNTEGNAVVANTDVGVNVRSGAGTSYQVVIKVYKGQRITVQAETQAEGLRWYNISFSLRGGSYSGWICADYVTLDGGVSIGGGLGGETTTVPDDQYVSELQAAGFPASYCNSLLALHQKYPNWQFVPVQTGLDWNTVIANESLVQQKSI